jgi:3-dehydro-4-phosphotetronate decarboxylase
MLAAAHRVGALGLSWGTSGNLSVRAGDGQLLVTGTGVRLGELEAGQIVTCALGADTYEGTRRPSVETGLHRSVLQARPDAGAVLHCSPSYTTMIAASALEVDPAVTTDGVYYVRAVARVGFHLPGSAELAAAVGAAARDADVLLLDHHGCVVLGADPDQAVNRAEVLEELCRMLVLETLGFPLARLSQSDVERLRRQGVA